MALVDNLNSTEWKIQFLRVLGAEGSLGILGRPAISYRVGSGIRTGGHNDLVTNWGKGSLS